MRWLVALLVPTQSTPLPAFLKDQLLIRSVLWLIDERRWTWMTNPPTKTLAISQRILFSVSRKDRLMLQHDLSSMKPQNCKPPRQTGIAEGISIFLMNACTFTVSAPPQSFFLPVLSNAHKHKFKDVLLTQLCCCCPPTSPHLLPVLAISQLSRRAADVTEEPSEHLSQAL